MKARRLIDGASFGPATLKVIGQAFDEAWAEIAGNFGDNPSQVENARLTLAEALLSIATEDSTNVTEKWIDGGLTVRWMSLVRAPIVISARP